MSFNQHLDSILEQVLINPGKSISNADLIHCIDLTLLENHSTKEELSLLSHLATEHHVAAVCVFPKDLPHLEIEHNIPLATVINFPQGDQSVSTCLRQIDEAVRYGAREIDYVVPYTLYLEGQQKAALEHTFEIVRYAKENSLLIKLILETGAFTEMSALYQFAQELALLNIDFLKTSTGKTHQGASFPAVLALLSAIKDSNSQCGIKVSGGVRTPQQARSYAYLAQLVSNKLINKSWFRIGASSLLKELMIRG